MMTLPTNSATPNAIKAARLLAVMAAGTAASALSLYVVQPGRLSLPAGLVATMAPLTAVAIITMALALLFRSWARPGVARIVAAVPALIALGVIGSRAVFKQDLPSQWIGQAVFGVVGSLSGQMSWATAASLLLLTVPLIGEGRGRLADVCNVMALFVAGVVLLGYAYGPDDSQALSGLSGVALPTAVSLFLLSGSAILSMPGSGWLTAMLSPRIGGRTIRRQLALLAVPLITGALLSGAVASGGLEAGAALAISVAVTIVPFTLLIVRDGRAVEAVEDEREAKGRLQAAFAREMQARLASQALELKGVAEKRAQADALVAQTQRLETVGQLTGGIAHDFNNLLMAINANLELLRRAPPDSPKAKRYADNALLAVSKGSKLTGQLLTFSRSQRLTIQPVELQAVIEHTRLLVTSAVGPHIELKIENNAGQAWVLCDADQLESALVNLVLNAKEAMPGGGRLEIRCCVEAPPGPDGGAREWVVVRVVDSGVGMTPDVKARATEPFFTTREVGKGTGLGLSQVYGLMRQCQGELHIDSKPGRGTLIELRLQPTAAIRNDDEVPQARQPIEAAAASRVQGVVLVVDDDDGVRGALVEVLTQAGFKVVEAHDGPSALALLKTVEPDAAVLDFIMPGMNGAELARRAKIDHPRMPIIFVSGYSDTVALDGISDAIVLRKPFDAEKLTTAVSRAVH